MFACICGTVVLQLCRSVSALPLPLLLDTEGLSVSRACTLYSLLREGWAAVRTTLTTSFGQ